MKMLLISLLLPLTLAQPAVLQPGGAAPRPPMPAEQAAPAPKVVAVVNRANWCPVCLLHGKRTTALMATYQHQPVAFVVNDLTNKATKAASRRRLEQWGIAEAVQPYNSTGTILLLDAATRRVLGEVSVSKSDAVLTQALNQALAAR